MILVWPTALLTVAAVLGGLLLIYAGLREFFRLVIERVPEIRKKPRPRPAADAAWRSSSGLRRAIIGGILYWRRPTNPALRPHQHRQLQWLTPLV